MDYESGITPNKQYQVALSVVPAVTAINQNQKEYDVRRRERERERDRTRQIDVVIQFDLLIKNIRSCM